MVRTIKAKKYTISSNEKSWGHELLYLLLMDIFMGNLSSYQERLVKILQSPS